MASVAAGLAAARRRIELAGGDAGAVRVVAVTKGFGAEAVEAASAVGLEDVGENYAQELLAKHEALRSEGRVLRWHFLGAVQRNKVRILAPVVDCWESVAREVEGVEIARRRPGATVLVELDAAGTPGRNGCPPEGVEGLVGALRGLDLDVAGLMTVAPPDPEGARRAFRTLRRLADRLSLRERSMGMSGDLELAVAEGTTMVRLGSALFGRRPPRRATGATGATPPVRQAANPSA